MTNYMNSVKIKPIHPFPARMAPSIVWENLDENQTPLKILDPMAGSGTTLVIAKKQGHQAIGCDTDPLAVMIARAWCTEVDERKVNDLANKVLQSAKEKVALLSSETAYPENADEETKSFIDFWFDDENRKQLAALSSNIINLEDSAEKHILMTAFSRLIITKKIGVSLAMDVSHSRPHRKYKKAPITPFEKFLHAVKYILNKAPFHTGDQFTPPAIILNSDARSIPINSSIIDIVITSPPYLNAIDYIRGHKLTMVWLGESIENLREIRSGNIGAEKALNITTSTEFSNILLNICDNSTLQDKHKKMIIRYLYDMGSTISECHRVLKKNGKAIFVIGNSSIHGNYINNSKALSLLAKNRGFEVLSSISRPIPQSKRYLPPPNSNSSGKQMKNRMREEVILTFRAI